VTVTGWVCWRADDGGVAARTRLLRSEVGWLSGRESPAAAQHRDTSQRTPRSRKSRPPPRTPRGPRARDLGWPPSRATRMVTGVKASWTRWKKEAV
jgi:hypothetical protein